LKKIIPIVAGISIFSLSVVIGRAIAGPAPEAVACNQTRAGILDRKDAWVLAKEDVADEGKDHYQLEALSAWAAVKNSEYCLRWELENQSPPVADTSNPTIEKPTIVKNAWWANVSLWKDRLEPGSGIKRATTWKQREYSSTPIDQDTDVTGGVRSSFKLKAYLPRVKQAANQNPETSIVERVAVNRDHFGDIATGYAEGETAVTVRSSVRTDRETALFGITMDGSVSKVSFPFAQIIRNAGSLQSFFGPLDYNPVEVPFARRELPLSFSQLEERSFFIVNQPFLIEGPWGRACLLVSVYSPVRRSFGRAACR
jgi:hypothetical protein